MGSKSLPRRWNLILAGATVASVATVFGLTTTGASPDASAYTYRTCAADAPASCVASSPAVGQSLKVIPAADYRRSRTRPTRTPRPAAPTTATPPASTATGTFPGPDNTGIPAGTALKNYTGPREITVADTQISGVIFTPGAKIIISAPGVVIRDSLFETYDTFDVSMNDTVPDATVDIWNSEFSGNPASFEGEEMAIRGEGWSLHAVNIHGYRDAGGIDGNDLVEDSWIHDFVISAACEHADGFQSLGDSSDVVIRHNTIDMALRSCMTAPIQLGNEDGANSDVTVTDNWLAGGSYVFYASMAPGDYPTHDIVFTGNHLSRKYFPTYGAYGVVNYWQPGTPGAVWSGNVDADTGATVLPPAP